METCHIHGLEDSHPKYVNSSQTYPIDLIEFQWKSQQYGQTDYKIYIGKQNW